MLLKCPNDTTSFNIDGTTYEPSNGFVEVENAKHADILKRPAFGFTDFDPDASDAILEPLPGFIVVAEQYPNIAALLGEVFTDDVPALLAAIEAKLVEPITDESQDVDPDIEIKRQLATMGVSYPAKAKTKVLESILSAEIAAREAANQAEALARETV